MDLTAALLALAAVPAGDDGFEEAARPVLAERCASCHGGPRPKGRLDLAGLDREAQLLARPEVIADLLDVVRAEEMPPEGEPPLDPEERTRLLAYLEGALRVATADAAPPRLPLRRLNRAQYSHAVRDLFQLDRDVFHLPEKLMSRGGDWLLRPDGRMPSHVDARSSALEGPGGLRDVDPYPKDLRAAHGFDNQADQLTLSPLLLDNLLRLAVSVVESPDFHAETVGVWTELFAAPGPEADLDVELPRRLRSFLTRAFRRPVEEEDVARYASYLHARLDAGVGFEDAMKKVAAAALSSPRFLFVEDGDDGVALASRLSFFLWGSGPDAALLERAASGALDDDAALDEVVGSMLADPRIERLLDAFPAQWLQLENALAATPDPAEHPAFYVDRARPASLQMVLEPLLLFDAVFVEDRPVVELVSPTFTYRSRFLERWYAGDVVPPPVDPVRLEAENAVRAGGVAELEGALAEARAAEAALAAGLPAREAAAAAALDLGPGQASWEAEQRLALESAVALGPWSRIGPFLADSFDVAHATEFVDAGALDLEAEHDGQRWTSHPELVDGQVHPLTGASCATYLHRLVHAPSARPLELRLGTDDSYKLWLNGVLVAEEKVTRGVAPDQSRATLQLREGQNELLLKVVNGGGGYGFHFQSGAPTLPEPVLTALVAEEATRTQAQREALAAHYRTLAPELDPTRSNHARELRAMRERVQAAQGALNAAPKPRPLEVARQEVQRRHDDELRGQVRSPGFQRVELDSGRYGGVLTNAAMLSMTSGPERTHPISRGAWVTEVLLNDPPEPPPNDVPPLSEEDNSHLTVRERFARHREDPSCAGCHATLDPLGFALEQYDTVGRFRELYDNGREVDASGTLFRRHAFDGAAGLKAALVSEERHFAVAFAGHLLRFALARELEPADWLAVEAIADQAEPEGYRLRSLLRAVATSDTFTRR